MDTEDRKKLAEIFKPGADICEEAEKFKNIEERNAFLIGVSTGFNLAMEQLMAFLDKIEKTRTGCAIVVNDDTLSTKTL